MGRGSRTLSERHGGPQQECILAAGGHHLQAEGQTARVHARGMDTAG